MDLSFVNKVLVFFLFYVSPLRTLSCPYKSILHLHNSNKWLKWSGVKDEGVMRVHFPVRLLHVTTLRDLDVS